MLNYYTTSVKACIVIKLLDYVLIFIVTSGGIPVVGDGVIGGSVSVVDVVSAAVMTVPLQGTTIALSPALVLFSL